MLRRGFTLVRLGNRILAPALGASSLIAWLEEQTGVREVDLRDPGGLGETMESVNETDRSWGSEGRDKVD